MKLAELFVQLTARDTGLRAGLASARGQITQFATVAKAQLAGVASAFGFGGAIGGGALALGMKHAIDLASDLNESMSKNRAVFKDAAGSVENFAAAMASKFGIVRKESLEAASSIGLLGQAAGMSARDSAAFGVQFAKLAADLSSFNNVPFADAVQRLMSGLSGEAEPLRRWGVFLSEDAVKAEALAKGIAKTTEEAKKLTEAQKIAARASLIMTQTVTAQGDLERTSDQYANLSRTLSGTFSEVMTRLGQELLPTAIDATKQLTSAFQELGRWVEQNGDTIADYFRNLGNNMNQVGSFIGGIVDHIVNRMAGRHPFIQEPEPQFNFQMQPRQITGMAPPPLTADRAAAVMNMGAFPRDLLPFGGETGPGPMVDAAQMMWDAASEFSVSVKEFREAEFLSDPRELARQVQLSVLNKPQEDARKEMENLRKVSEDMLKVLRDMQREGVLGVLAP